MPTQSKGKVLLSIVELGGYPNFASLYGKLGYSVLVENTMRKAISAIRKHCPDVIVAEFNYQSDFRDRTSSLETMLAVVQRYPHTRVIVFFEDEYAHQFERVTSRFPIHAALKFPVDTDELQRALVSAARDA
ncbi:MAG: hypothetical protein JSW10_03290 [Pseudomonadota bacterium]|nr:MAG: hypothetical protein JSW10_03290 [Pseudomonadota bacterium]